MSLLHPRPPCAPPPREGYGAAVVESANAIYLIGGHLQKPKKEFVAGEASTLWKHCLTTGQWQDLPAPPGNHKTFAHVCLVPYGQYIICFGGDLQFATRVFDTQSDTWMSLNRQNDPPVEFRNSFQLFQYRPYRADIVHTTNSGGPLVCTRRGDRIFAMICDWDMRIYSLRLNQLTDGVLPDWEHLYTRDRQQETGSVLKYPIESASVGKDGHLWFGSQMYEYVFAVDEDGEKVAVRLLSPNAGGSYHVVGVPEVLSQSPHYNADGAVGFGQYGLEIGGDHVGISFRRPHSGGKHSMEYCLWTDKVYIGNETGSQNEWTPLPMPFSITKDALEQQFIRFVYASDTKTIWCITSGKQGKSMAVFPVLHLEPQLATLPSSMCHPLQSRSHEACLQSLVRVLTAQSPSAQPGEVVISFTDGVKIAACRSILEVTSDYFKNLFNGTTADARATELTLDVSSEAGQCVLLLMHAGSLSELPSDPEVCLGILTLADYLQLKSYLLDALNRVVTSALTDENVATILEIASRTSNDTLREACNRYMQSLNPQQLIAMMHAQCSGPSAKRARHD